MPNFETVVVDTDLLIVGRWYVRLWSGFRSCLLGKEARLEGYRS